MSPTPATILIVDDEIQNRKLLEVLLRPEGYVTLTAATGQEALASVAQRAPDLILLDVMMPGMDGYEVAGILKANTATSNIPIIMVTALTDRSARLAGLNAGAEEFLTKPVERAELWLRVRNLLRLKALGDFLQNHAVILEQQVQARTESLHASESRFRQIAENIRDVFFLVDADSHRLLYISPVYEEIWGRSCESAYANEESWMEAIHPDDRASTYDKYKKGMSVGKFEYEYRIVHPDDSIHAIAVRGFPVRDDAGRMVRIACVAVDITQRKRAVQELRRSESVKSAILKSSLDCLITIDHEGKIVEFNPAAEATFGLTREQALGKTMVELIVPPRLRDAHRRGFAHYLATGEGPILGKRLELEAMRADGTEFPIELAITAIGATSTPMFTGFIRDITARKEAEGKIKRLNRVYAVLSGINTLIVRVHERRELFNEACRIVVEHGNFGIAWIGTFDPATQDVTPVAWAGEHAEEIANTKRSARDDTPRGKGSVGQAIRERRPVFNNDITAHGFGGPRLKEIRGLGLRSHITLPLFENQAVIGTLTMYAREPNFFDEEELRLLTDLAGDISFAVENISRQQKLDKLSRIRAVSSRINAAIVRIRERKALLEEVCRIVSEQGKFGLIWIGTIDHDNKKVEPVAWAGFSEEAAHAVNWGSISIATGTLGEAIRTRMSSVRNDIEAELPAGRLRQDALEQGFHSAVSLPLVVNDRVTAVVVLFAAGRGFFDKDELALLDGVASDISFALKHIEKGKALADSEKKLLQLNEELEDKVTVRTVDLERARREAEAANRAKSMFLATMSHEIRTPMNGVIGMVDVLHQSSLKGDQVEMVDLIRESAFSLLGVINDILDFSKIEAGKVEIERDVLAVADVMEGVCNLLNGMATKKNVTLTLFSDPTIPAQMLGDTLRLRQVLVNLINNAIKFSGGQSHAGQVSVRALLFESSPQQVTVEFRVTDNGIGMDGNTQARLFTPFTQADASTTRHFGGTGLGLAIANQLVQLMGGKITVQSALGEGAAFTVRLPFALSAAKTDAFDLASKVAGLFCVVVGAAGGLADDLAIYLEHANAVVERAPDLAGARAQTVARSGLSVWVVETGGESQASAQMRAAAHARTDQDVRFVVVLVERGRRRRPRAVAPDLITVDGNALSGRTFLKAVAAAAGRASLETEAGTLVPSKIASIAPSRAEAVRRGRLILIAEDNETNQKVIMRQLALLGHTADVAADGGEALRRWQRGEYALLLTDLHMPKMDGYELTRAIRAEEKGDRRMPIVALTANALKSEDEHCRAEGMDDYRSKPLPLADLKTVLDKWLPSAQPEPDASGLSAPATLGTAQSEALVPVDVNVLRQLVGDDPDIVHEFLQDFRKSAARITAELRAACATNQPKSAASAAHKLKSSARAVGAFALGELCAVMEDEGKAGAVDALAVLLPRFETEMALVEDFLNSLEMRCPEAIQNITERA